jgi:hypothetical protein
MLTSKSSDGGMLGAVYLVAAPLGVFTGETEPHGPDEHDTVQVTPSFLGSLVTAAVSCAVPLA